MVNWLTKPPDPTKIREYTLRLKQAIDDGESPAKLLYEAVQQPTIASAIIKTTLKNYKEVVELLASPRGRKYLQITINNLLDYVKELANQP